MGTLIAEDLLLLLLDDEKGSVSGTSYADTVLGGAVLVELALTGAVQAERTSRWRTPKVRVTAGATVEDPLLADRLAVAARKERSAEDLVKRLGKGLTTELAERLAARGVLERRVDRVLGLFPRTRWPAVDASREREVRQALSLALVRGLDPDERTGALVALLHAVDLTPKVVDREGLSRGEVRRRAKEISRRTWAATAVRDAIEAATAGTTAAVVAATTVATTTTTT
jgi:hypothetical protein